MKTPNPLRGLRALFLITLLMSTIAVASAAAMTIGTGTLEAQTGSTLEVPIQLGGAPGVGALHVELVYDPQVLAPEAVTKGALAGNNALLESNLARPGRVVFGLVTLDGIKGDGTVATVKFKAIGNAGAKSALRFENCAAWEGGTHAEVLVTTQDGQVTIASGFPTWLLLALIALIAFVILLLIIFLMMRRRKPVPVQSAYASQPYTPSYAPPPSGAPSGNVPERGGDAGWTCPRCKTVNRATSRFCKTCGTAHP